MSNPIKICVILTASIDPKGCFFLKRSDPNLREQDYIWSLKKWFKTDLPIIFCENSGYSLLNIKNVIQEYAKNKEKIELLQFEGNNYPRELGKGYGEMLILRYLIENSKLIQGADYVLKVTGRYGIRNVNRIIESLNQNVYVMADMKEEMTPSIVFISKVSFIKDYLLKYQESINDSQGFYFEHALASAIKDARRDGFLCRAFERLPVINGYSGTDNRYIIGGKAIIDQIKKNFMQIKRLLLRKF